MCAPVAETDSRADTYIQGSNDMIKSTIHRVRAPPHKSKDGMTPERYSIPYVRHSPSLRRTRSHETIHSSAQLYV